MRGAGFPASRVLSLASPATAEAADRVVAGERETGERREAAIGAVNTALDALRKRGLWQEARLRRPLLDALRSLGKDAEPGELSDSAAEAAVARWRRSREGQVADREQFGTAFGAAVEEQSWELHRIARDHRFREAVLWQNRRALRSGIEPIARSSPAEAPRNSQRRQHEELVASYLQRYCVKNDTIGFFGPCGWGSFDDAESGLRVRPGQSLLASSSVYFESWAIAALAAALEQRHPRLRAWIAPQLSPYARLEGNLLSLRPPRVLELAEHEVRLLRACDGLRPATVLAADALQAPGAGFAGEEEVFAFLERLRQEGAVLWSFRVPLGPRSEEVLGRQLDRVGDPELRRQVLEPLTELLAARDAVGRAAGDAEALDHSLGHLETVFRANVGASAHRGAGRMYVGRTVVYQDCRRDLDLRVGRRPLADLAPSLELLLSSARWHTQAFREPIYGFLEEVFRRGVRRSGGREVDLIRYWYELVPRLLREEREKELGRAVLPEFQRRWSEVLRLPAGERRVAYSSDELRPRVREAFGGARPGWSLARYQAPDLMIAASSVEAVGEGDYLWVLGELHQGINPLNCWVFLSEHPAPEEAASWFEGDPVGPLVFTQKPRQWPDATTRTETAVYTSRSYVTGLPSPVGPGPRPHFLPMSSLVVTEAGGMLQVASRDGRFRLNVFDFFGEILSGLVANSFRIPEPAPHTPRVTIDWLVVQRERWELPVAELEPADAPTPRERFLGVRRWAGEHGMPRFVFVKVPVEKKPIYLDLSSPVFCEIFLKAIRRSRRSGPDGSRVTVTEMLPTPEQTWLTDAEGNRYTCELRTIAVDLEAPPETKEP